MQDARETGGKVLIHCQQGVSRSASLAIAFIMKETAQTYTQVLDQVRAKRGIISPSLGFALQVSLL